MHACTECAQLVRKLEDCGSQCQLAVPLLHPSRPHDVAFLDAFLGAEVLGKGPCLGRAKAAAQTQRSSPQYYGKL